VKMPTSNKKSSPNSAANQCAICLSNIEPKKRSVISTCLHEFCFSCIKKWSKENAVCPLCKQNFTEILSNIRSDADYDVYKITITNQTGYRRYNRSKILFIFY
ncbi:hypothetical protein HELRODRAFT_67664, partial [Helobdella robusta]|uniref:RING-type E3 ubiquitin transferase n=1 Tax=Helobdella robusta TaxID=6412 RepID=T1FZ36_HELRO